MRFLAALAAASLSVLLLAFALNIHVPVEALVAVAGAALAGYAASRSSGSCSCARVALLGHSEELAVKCSERLLAVMASYSKGGVKIEYTVRGGVATLCVCGSHPELLEHLVEATGCIKVVSYVAKRSGGGLVEASLGELVSLVRTTTGRIFVVDWDGIVAPGTLPCRDALAGGGGNCLYMDFSVFGRVVEKLKVLSEALRIARDEGYTEVIVVGSDGLEATVAEVEAVVRRSGFTNYKLIKLAISNTYKGEDGEVARGVPGSRRSSAAERPAVGVEGSPRAQPAPDGAVG